MSSGTADPVAARELAGRIESVRARIDRATRRSGRDPSDVLLVAAAKDVDADMVAAAARCGITDVGENRAQELRSKQAALQGIPIRWHFIGVLQRNKAKDVVGRVVLVHSVDSVALASIVSRRATTDGTVQDVLLEVNVGGERSKRGVALEEVPEAARAIDAMEGISLRGLMAVPPQARDPERARPFFATLREAGTRLRRSIPGAAELSMGMSADFEVAIEEGATIVRVGRAIFGPRPLH